MKHFGYLIEHWDQIVIYAVSAQSTRIEWLRTLAPFVLAVLAAAAVSMIVVREQVSDIKTKVDRGILPVADERIGSIKLELLQIHHEHELLGERVTSIEASGPIYCLRCHMRQGFNHPKVNK